MCNSYSTFTREDGLCQIELINVMIKPSLRADVEDELTAFAVIVYFRDKMGVLELN